jgi:hypothetical protein
MISFARLALVVATAALALSGVAAHAKSVPRAGSSVTIRGGTVAQRKLARLVALRVGGVTIESVRFREPSASLRGAHIRASELVVSSSRPRTLRAQWEGELYAGTFLALAGRYRVPVGAIEANGREAPLQQWRPLDLFSQIPSARAVGALVGRLVEATAAGATVLEERTAATPARAITLRIRVDDPAAFLKHRARPILHLLSRARVPLIGFYVGLEDARGQLVWATSQVGNEGGLFVIPSLDACSPVSHAQAGGPPPPCPSK